MSKSNNHTIILINLIFKTTFKFYKTISVSVWLRSRTNTGIKLRGERTSLVTVGKGQFESLDCLGADSIFIQVVPLNHCFYKE